MIALGIVFSDIHEWNMGDLTSRRTVAAIPFGGRYWLIDFVLSNMINSGIHKVGVITKSNYQQLMDHIGSGKDWDLARKNGGISVLPPFGADSRTGLYRGRLDALMRIISYIEASTQEYVVMSDCDMICNIDYNEVIDFHVKTRADITAVYNEHYVDRETAANSILYNIPRMSGRVQEVTLHPHNIEGSYKISMNTWVMRRDYLIGLITSAIANGKTHFSSDILLTETKNINIMGYAHKGYCAHINSVSNYFKHNMEMLDSKKRAELFYSSGRNIYTKVRDSEPTKYRESAVVKNSLIADGCDINGIIENSIISRGVKINKNTEIKNCILMQDTIIGEESRLEWIITDKSAVITDGKTLIADKEYLMYVTKNKRI
ncbi:MAG: glucose-1-phosphate adenylyltransferase subunit GlgD [Oscillospiraceae bacterium]|nr:glucose-1-phosphate adenylyltransferase subunit GlgD [Oscillospiraceae bacterium]